MSPIVRLIVRIAHGDEILAVLGVAAFAMILAAVNAMPVPQ